MKGSVEDLQVPSLLPSSSQTYPGGMSLIQITIPPAEVFCETVFELFGYFEFPRPAQGLIQAFSNLEIGLFLPATMMKSMFVALLGYLVFASLGSLSPLTTLLCRPEHDASPFPHHKLEKQVKKTIQRLC
ncbi:hypothetical protein RF11_03155 [Thelohanellus kitauei]|uniref:Uncharacterized protein n=1 Tax=Thelohanellus kitauei TaxID=669202 RepID=A0A0C2JZI2_THEKT|nr:hypothetical protein RF11_03155 [Thelohanellus kitauei]